MKFLLLALVSLICVSAAPSYNSQDSNQRIGSVDSSGDDAGLLGGLLGNILDLDDIGSKTTQTNHVEQNASN